MRTSRSPSRGAPGSAIVRRVGLGLAVSLLCGAGASGEPAETAGEPVVRRPWSPPAPDPEEDDWIRLTSGEWLKGEVLRLRSEVLEFDSDELDELEIDLEDLAELRSARRYAYGFQDRSVLLGSAAIRDGVVQVLTADGVRERPVDELLSIVTGAEREIERWDGRLSLGITARSGNTEQSDFSGRAFVRRSGPFARARADYEGTFGKTEGTENINNHRGKARIDLFLSRRLYVTPASAEVFHDRFQNVRLRVTPGLGVGYTLVDRAAFEWEVFAGAGAQYTRFSSTSPGESSERYRGAVLASTGFESELTSRVDFDAEYSLQLPVPEIEEAIHHALAVLEVELNDILDLDVSLTWDRLETPEVKQGGDRPKRDDFRLTVGLALEL